MKRIIVSTIMAAGLLLLAACGTQEGIGMMDNTEYLNTPTPIVVPTCTPTATPSPDPAKVPEVTEALKPTGTPTPGITATPTPEPTITPTTEPTEAPTATETPVPSLKPTEVPTLGATATPTPEPTATPTAEPAEPPEVTETPVPDPEPMGTPTPELTVTPMPTPTPAVDPKPLVYRGWQQTISIDKEYLIIFPELFRGSTVEKTETELKINYTCEENPEISFSITYSMKKTLEDCAEEIRNMEEADLEWFPEEKRVEFRYPENGTVYHGALVESRYARTLLGDTFGEEEWTTGVMRVVFSYPEEDQNEYETVIYRYFVINGGEE